MRILFKDIIAVVIIILLFVCKIIGMDGMIDTSIALIIGYYFSKRLYEEKQNGK